MPASKFDPTTEQWLNSHEVCALRHCKKTKLYDDVKIGAFPAPVWFGPRKARWAKSWVDAHVGALIQDAERHNAKLMQRQSRRRAA